MENYLSEVKLSVVQEVPDMHTFKKSPIIEWMEVRLKAMEPGKIYRFQAPESMNAAQAKSFLSKLQGTLSAARKKMHPDTFSCANRAGSLYIKKSRGVQPPPPQQSQPFVA